MTIHEQLIEQFKVYQDESKRFEERHVKASAARARKALAEITKLGKARRQEIQDQKNDKEEE